MVLIFDYFETLVHNQSKDYDRGLKELWEKYYREKCDYEDIKKYAGELFQHMQDLHKQGREYAFVKDQLPKYADKYGGELILMTAEEEADFLMRCNEMEVIPGIREALTKIQEMGIPMYVLSNSSYTAEALSVILHRLGIGHFFADVWSSADFGRIKPCRDFFEMGIEKILQDHPGTERKDILFVGDTYETDVIGAQEAGIDAVWINHRGAEHTNQRPAYMISEAGELEKVIMDIKTGQESGNH